MNNLMKVSLRQQAIFIPDDARVNELSELSSTTGVLIANLSKLGFGVTGDLLHTINRTTPAFHLSVLETLREVTGVSKNWNTFRVKE